MLRQKYFSTYALQLLQSNSQQPNGFLPPNNSKNTILSQDKMAAEKSNLIKNPSPIHEEGLC